MAHLDAGERRRLRGRMMNATTPEKTQEDYDQNGFHTSSLWGAVGVAISSVLVIRVERLLPHAELADVAKRHRLDWLVEAGISAADLPAVTSKTVFLTLSGFTNVHLGRRPEAAGLDLCQPLLFQFFGRKGPLLRLTTMR
jgi:hypothetical protein